MLPNRTGPAWSLDFVPCGTRPTTQEKTNSPLAGGLGLCRLRWTALALSSESPALLRYAPMRTEVKGSWQCAQGAGPEPRVHTGGFAVLLQPGRLKLGKSPAHSRC